MTVTYSWNNPSTCPRTATCRRNLQLYGGMVSDGRRYGWFVDSSTMVKYEELVLWRRFHVVGSSPPERGALHGVEVWPIEGGLKMLVHEVESLADDGIGLGMLFLVMMISLGGE